MALLGSNNPKLTAMLYGEIPQLVAQAEEIIKRTFDKTGGNISEASEQLKVGRATMYRWLRDFPSLKVHLNKLRRE